MLQRMFPALFGFYVLTTGCRANLPRDGGFQEIGERIGLAADLPAWDVLATDIDGDGSVEVLIGSHSDSTWLEVRDKRLVSDPLSPWLQDNEGDRHGLAACDLDGDRQKELVVNTGGAGGAGGQPAEVWTRRSKKGAWKNIGGTALRGSASLRGRGVTCADINGDGQMEVHLSAEGSPDLLLRPGAQGGAQLPTFSDGSASAHWADLNGDNLPDVLRIVNEKIHIQLQQATGVLLDAVELPELDHVATVALEDLDGDGDLDLYAGITVGPGRGDLFSAGRARLRYRSQDSDRVTWTLSADCDEVTIAARGRLDGSRVQLTTAGSTPAGKVILVRGNASRPDSTAPLTAWIEGDELVVQAQASKGNVEIGLQCRDGTRPKIAKTVVEAQRPRHSTADQLLWNQGDGTFLADPHALGEAGTGDTVDVQSADFDSDGDVDLFVVRGRLPGTLESAPDILLENQGKGTFSQSSLFRDTNPTGVAGRAVWVDLTGDGAVDLLQLPSEYGGPLGAAPKAWENPY